MLDEIKKRLLEGNEEERRLAVDSLREPKGKVAMNLIISALGDSSWRVRKTAEDALEAYIGEEELVQNLISSLRSEENAGLRNSAAAVLIRVGRSAIPYLKETLKDHDRDMRKFTADILGEIGEVTAAPSLIEALRDSDDNVRAAAAEALGKIGGDEVVNALVSILAEAGDDLWLRFSALESLGRIGKGIPVEPIVGLLEDKLLRKAAFDALGKSGDPKVIPHLITGFRDKGKGSREAAVVNFNLIYKTLPAEEKERFDEEIRRNSDVHLLSDLLDSPSIEVRKGGVVILGIIGEGVNPSCLLNLASDERVQEVVTDALVGMKEKVLETLINTLPKSEERMRQYICKVLGLMGDKKALKALIMALSDSYGHARQTAAQSIAEIGAVEAVPFLIPLLSDEYEDVEEAAVKAMITIGKDHPDEVVSRLQNGMAAHGSSLRKNMITILGGIGGKNAVPAILASMKDEDRNVRKAAATALGNLLPEGEIDHLALALADEDSQVRLAGVHALGKFCNREAERLLTLASGDEDVWVRCAALKGLSKTLSDDAEETIGSAIMDGVGVVAITALDALFSMKGSAAAEAIKKGLNHKDQDVVKTAKNILSKII
ncbi:MAG TPA: HEAT repeat domain-containing protein [Thermodesulfobacteriota bacterium]|nr:HEAT repeat domain-containing protein [Thermodesulfobacteriota bacterium]